MVAVEVTQRIAGFAFTRIIFPERENRLWLLFQHQRAVPPIAPAMNTYWFMHFSRVSPRLPLIGDYPLLVMPLMSCCWSCFTGGYTGLFSNCFNILHCFYSLSIRLLYILEPSSFMIFPCFNRFCYNVYFHLIVFLYYFFEGGVLIVFISS